jgi:ATP-binding cassette subfamily C protein CydC
MMGIPDEFKPLTQQLAAHWKWMALGALLGLLASLSGIGLLALSGWFITATAVAGLHVATAKLFNFFLPGIGVRMLAISRTLARYAERLTTHDATFRILRNLRVWSYRRIEPLAPAPLMTFRSGDLLNRVVADIDTLDHLYLRVLSPVFIAGASAAAVCGLLVVFHPATALWVLMVLLLCGIGIPLFAARSGATTGRDLARQEAVLRTRLIESILGLPELLVYDTDGEHTREVMASHHRLVKYQRRLSHIGGAASGMMILGSGLAVAAVLVTAVPRIAGDTLPGAVAVMMVMVSMAVFEALLPLVTAFQFFGQAREAAARLDALVRTEPAVRFPDQDTTRPDDGGVVFDRVRFRYGEEQEPALDDISFAVAPGERVAVIGETGSGKTTLFNLMVRFWDPDAGSIRVGNRPLPDLSEACLREWICVVAQQSHLFHASIRDNLLVARPDAGDEDLWKALDGARLEAWVRTLPDGLDTWVGESGRQLSGGQARRLAVARGILRDAPIWLLDEPTEGLDRITEAELVDDLLTITTGKTLIMITHRLTGLDRMDRVMVLEGGRMAASGAPADILSSRRFKSPTLPV